MKKVAPTEEDVPAAVLLKDPPECSVLELKRWLESHGVKMEGKKRVDRQGWRTFGDK